MSKKLVDIPCQLFTFPAPNPPRNKILVGGAFKASFPDKYFEGFCRKAVLSSSLTKLYNLPLY